MEVIFMELLFVKELPQIQIIKINIPINELKDNLKYAIMSILYGSDIYGI